MIHPYYYMLHCYDNYQCEEHIHCYLKRNTEISNYFSNEKIFTTESYRHSKNTGPHKTWQNIWWIQLHQLNLTKIQILYLPVQVTPLPVYPVLQAQVNDPSVLVHVALLWQLWVPRVHSLLSENEHRNIKSLPKQENIYYR